MNLQDATTVTRSGKSYTAVIDPEWCFWGPIGGYVASIALRAVGLAAPADHRPVTFTCQFLAKGEPGETEVIVEPLKSGNTSFFNVRLIQQGVTFLQAQICTTSKVEGPDQVGMEAPKHPPPEALESIAVRLERAGLAPMHFWKNVDGRQIDPRPPGDPDPRGCHVESWLSFGGWEVTSDPFLDGSRALILIDTNIWRAYNRGQSEPVRHVAPSLDLAVWFHDAAPESQWQLIEGNADFARHSLLSGSSRVWSRDGRLVASGGGQCLFIPLERK